MKIQFRYCPVKFVYALLGFLFVGNNQRAVAISWPALMTEVALRQAESPEPSWDPAQRDCAGFVRYVYQRVFGGNHPLWRDKLGKPRFFLRAEELIGYNFKPVPRVGFDAHNFNHIKTGDVLVYYDPDKQPFDSWHVMLVIFLRDGERNQPLVIYHNGARDESGSVRKIWWDTLLSPSWSGWKPDPRNPRFKGIYRWNKNI